jgi:hypothetical protein
MPQVLVSMGGVQFFGTLWFLLLFFAAFTSSVAVAQPVMAFLQDETRIGRNRSTLGLAVLWGLGIVPCIVWAKYGFWEEIDFWAGTMGLIIFAFVEVVLFLWIFGSRKAWDEMHLGADLRIPKVFYFIMKYVTPVYLLALMVLWPIQDLGKVLNPAPNVTEAIKGRAALKGLVKVVEGQGAVPDEVKKWVSANRLDCRVAAALSIDAAGRVAGVRVTEGTGEPARIVEEQLRKRVYAPYREEARAAARPVELEVVIEGLYTTPYIWASRALMAALFGLFCVLTFRVWKRRSEAPAA